MEQWVTILESPDYSVSDLGRVRNNFTGRKLRIVRTSDRYCYVGFQKHTGEQVKRGVAKLVLDAFSVQPENFDTPIHLDGDPYNCCAYNLMWRPRWFAIKHKLQFMRDSARQTDLIIRDRHTKEELEIWEAVIKYGLLYTDILMAIEHNTYVFPTMQHFEWVY